MLRYIPTTASAGIALTEALWHLHCPPGEGSTTGFGTVVTALDGSVWLEIDDAAVVHVHESAVLDGIADILQPWIDSSSLPPDTNTVLAALIESKRGQMLTVYDAFPPLFKGMSLTTAEMIEQGKLANPEVTP
jgi:hypothetical protein